MQAEMSEDVRFVYKDKQWAFFLKVLEKACLLAGFSNEKTTKIMGLRSKFISGFHTDRDVPRDTWADPVEIREMQRQKDAMVAAGKWVVVPKSKSPPAVCFPVRQKTKTRLCIDLRQHNKCVRVKEKMRLLGTRATAEIITRLASDKATPVTLFQCKRDVTEDVAVERRLVKNLANAKAAAGDGARDFGPSIAEDVCDRYGDPDFASSFIPVDETKDVETYYYNFAAACKELNSFAVPKLSEAEKTAFAQGLTPPKIATDREWDAIESLVTVFGSLVSVYEDVGVSEALMVCKVVALRKLAPVYIDDVHILDRKKSTPSSSALVDLFLALIGFPQQMHKQAKNYADPTGGVAGFAEALRRSLVSLGLAYTRSQDEDSMSISVPADKIGRLGEMLRQVLAAIRDRCLMKADVESARGMFRHCAQLSLGAAGIAKALDPWRAADFARRIKDAKQRRQLTAAVTMLLCCVESFKPKVIAKGFPAVVRHVYGDAALGDLSKARPAARKGWVDVSGCGIHIGALLVDQNFAGASGFTHQIREMPAWAVSLRPDIAFFETLCAHVAQNFFATELCTPPAMCVHHVDNTAECYAIVKGSSLSISTQLVLMGLHADISAREVYWAWIASERNLSDPLTRLEKMEELQKALPTRCEVLGGDVFNWDRYRKGKQQRSAC
eukprot:g9716.t1